MEYVNRDGTVVPFLFTNDASEYLQIKEDKVVYFVVTIYFDEEKDKKDYFEYINAVKPIVNKYCGRYIVRSEKITALSSDWSPDRVIIIEFDTREQLEMCFASKEYKKLAFLRENSVDSKAIIIE